MDHGWKEQSPTDLNERLRKFATASKGGKASSGYSSSSNKERHCEPEANDWWQTTATGTALLEEEPYILVPVQPDDFKVVNEVVEKLVFKRRLIGISLFFFAQKLLSFGFQPNQLSLGFQPNFGPFFDEK